MKTQPLPPRSALQHTLPEEHLATHANCTVPGRLLHVALLLLLAQKLNFLPRKWKTNKQANKKQQQQKTPHLT
ncbi:TPA: hypothetical protein RNI81_004033 [Shigella sonnei]|nr:hypothetical protein [Shigella sonnei]